MGLRLLNRANPDYEAKYFGVLRDRDAAYRQGTFWAWLIGPSVDAWLKVYPDDRSGARKFLEGVSPGLSTGCIAQAWSVAELLRCLVLTEPA